MVEAIAQELRSMGHEVFIHRSAGPAVSSPAKTSGGNGKLRPRWLRNMFWFCRALLRNRSMLARDLEVIDTIKPEIILARQDAYCLSMPLAASLRKIPLVTYADAPTAYETRRYGHSDGRFHPPFLVEAIERWTLGVSQNVVTVSAPAARLLRLYGSRTPIHVVSNGIAPERFPKMSAGQRSEARAALGLTAPLVAGFAGSFKVFHGIDKLRDLILATSSREDLQWLLIGDGPQRAALEESLAGKAAVIFLGRRPSEEVGKLLELIDVAVAPHPQLEGEFYFCPLKILEYMAAGCAVLASQQGDIPELLDHGQAGVTISDPSTTTWTQALLHLLDHPDWRESLGDSAKARAVSQYTWARTAKTIDMILSNSVRSQPDLSPPRCESRVEEGIHGRLPSKAIATTQSPYSVK